jgi:hypothetical protein
MQALQQYPEYVSTSSLQTEHFPLIVLLSITFYLILVSILFVPKSTKSRFRLSCFGVPFLTHFLMQRESPADDAVVDAVAGVVT